METPRTHNAKKISSIYRDPRASVRYKMSDSRFVHIYYRLRIHRALCTGEYVRSRCARTRARGDEKREAFQATRKLLSIPPPCRRFFDGFLGEVTPMTPRTYHRHRSGRREISSMEINFRLTGATGRALVCARVSTWRGEHFRSHAPIASEMR